MIETVADFLRELMEQENMRLSSYELRHGPTIGDMYEGLSRDLLGRAIPPTLNLQIVTGFVVDDEGNMSGQIDCMLVRGEGSRIPYTETFKWNIKDVLAVLEVKKSLYGAELSDAFDHFQTLGQLESNYFDSLAGEGGEVDVRSGQRAFEVLTGVKAPRYDQKDALTQRDQALLNVFIMEQLRAIRVILGYNGFKSEYNFRSSLYHHLDEKIKASPGGARGGPASFPQLIISGRYSLCKMNGQPFMARLLDGKWPFYVSSSANPLELLLEYIWTRLSREYSIAGLWGEDLRDPAMHPYLLATVGEYNGNIGWIFEYNELSNDQLAEAPASLDWEPTRLTAEQFQVIYYLCSGREVSFDDDGLTSWLRQSGFEIEKFKADLIDTGLVALNGSELELTTEKLLPAILPTGEFVAGEDNTGRMTRWLMRLIESRRNEGLQ